MVDRLLHRMNGVWSSSTQDMKEAQKVLPGMASDDVRTAGACASAYFNFEFRAAFVLRDYAARVFVYVSREFPVFFCEMARQE